MSTVSIRQRVPLDADQPILALKDPALLSVALWLSPLSYALLQQGRLQFLDQMLLGHVRVSIERILRSQAR